MKVGIHLDQYGKFCEFIERFEKILQYNGIKSLRMDINEFNFWDKIKEIDLFIYRFMHSDNDYQIAHTILPIIEFTYNVKCFPNKDTYWTFDDKIRQYYLMKSIGIPYVDTWIFFDKKKALDWVETADFPIVFKLKIGASSQNVILVKSKRFAIKIINIAFGYGFRRGKINLLISKGYREINLIKTFHRYGGNVLRKLRDEDIYFNWQTQKNYIYFQKYLPDNEYDTRITVIGDRAFGFKRGVRKKDFRASGSGIINYDLKHIDTQFIKIAFDISKKMNFQSMAYDFIYDINKNPFICELSYTYIDSAVYDCQGYWDPDLNWHEGHYWPQYCQLVDLLNLRDLKQPDFEYMN